MTDAAHPEWAKQLHREVALLECDAVARPTEFHVRMRDDGLPREQWPPVPGSAGARVHDILTRLRAFERRLLKLTRHIKEPS